MRDGSLRYQADDYVFDKDSPAVYHYARQAAHHHLYTVAKSNAMNGAAPGSRLTGMPTATMVRIALSAAAGGLLLLIIALTVKKHIRRNR